MRIDFPYPGYERIAPVEVPDANLMGVYAPRAVGRINEEEVLARGFSEPIGAPRLREVVKPADRVLILVDDGTRGTPVPRLLKCVAGELWAAGVSDKQIRLLTAQGTHSEMREAELQQKLGDFYGRFEVHQHRWLDESNLREFGHTSDGTRVTANRLLAEANFVVGLGSIVPHRVKGFSGGAKIAFPGVAGREMQERNQWEASLCMSETVMGVADNPMRLRMEEAARLMGLVRVGAPIHPIFVHFTIALTSASLVFDALGFFFNKRSLTAAGGWTLVGAALMTLATLSTGLTSSTRAPVEEGEARSFLRAHMALGFIFYGLLVAIFFWRVSLWQSGQGVSWVYLAALAFVSLVMTAQGYLGGELVYRYGVEVEQAYRVLPEREAKTM